MNPADDLDDIRDGLAATPTRYPPEYTHLMNVKCVKHGKWLVKAYVRNRRHYVVFLHTFTVTVGGELDTSGAIRDGKTYAVKGKTNSAESWGVRYLDTAAPDVMIDCNNDCCAESIPVGWIREQLASRRASVRYPPK